MKLTPSTHTIVLSALLALLVTAPLGVASKRSFAFDGGSGGGSQTETIKVSKCYCNAGTTGGQMLIKASSSNASARLFAYRPDGTYQCEVQNGGGSRYGGTVIGYLPYDPGSMTIKSSSGASITVPTTPFQL